MLEDNSHTTMEAYQQLTVGGAKLLKPWCHKTTVTIHICPSFRRSITHISLDCLCCSPDQRITKHWRFSEIVFPSLKLVDCTLHAGCVVTTVRQPNLSGRSGAIWGWIHHALHIPNTTPTHTPKIFFQRICTNYTTAQIVPKKAKFALRRHVCMPALYSVAPPSL